MEKWSCSHEYVMFDGMGYGHYWHDAASLLGGCHQSLDTFYTPVTASQLTFHGESDYAPLINTYECQKQWSLSYILLLSLVWLLNYHQFSSIWMYSRTTIHNHRINSLWFLFKVPFETSGLTVDVASCFQCRLTIQPLFGRTVKPSMRRSSQPGVKAGS